MHFFCTLSPFAYWCSSFLNILFAFFFSFDFFGNLGVQLFQRFIDPFCLLFLFDGFEARIRYKFSSEYETEHRFNLLYISYSPLFGEILKIAKLGNDFLFSIDIGLVNGCSFWKHGTLGCILRCLARIAYWDRFIFFINCICYFIAILFDFKT